MSGETPAAEAGTGEKASLQVHGPGTQGGLDSAAMADLAQYLKDHGFDVTAKDADGQPVDIPVTTES